jgi:hypothetical protein
MILLSDDKAPLWDWRDAIAEQLAAVRLRLHPTKPKVSRTDEGLDVLGYHVFPHRRGCAMRTVCASGGGCAPSPVVMPRAGWTGTISIPACKPG